MLSLWIAVGMFYTAYLVLEFKNSLVIGSAEQKLQRIEEATDLTQLKRTSKMYIDFQYGVHQTSVDLWKINVVYAVLNAGFLGFCVICLCRCRESGAE
jgi:hypothetical protein